MTNLFVTDNDGHLEINPELNCILGVFGIFADEDKKPTPSGDAALKALESAGIIPLNADISIVFEAAIVPTPDKSAFYIEVRHFSVRDFIDGKKSERTYVATLAITTPSETVDGATIALGNATLGRVGKNSSLPIEVGKQLGAYPRYRSNLMPWNRISGIAKSIYDEDVESKRAGNKVYMPVSFSLTLSETEDGNKFLRTLGELFETAKGDAAKELSGLIDPSTRAAAAQAKENAAETLRVAEEDALIALRQAEAELAAAASETAEKRAVLAAKVDKAKRAYDRAVLLRKAALGQDEKHPS